MATLYEDLLTELARIDVKVLASAEHRHRLQDTRTLATILIEDEGVDRDLDQLDSESRFSLLIAELDTQTPRLEYIREYLAKIPTIGQPSSQRFHQLRYIRPVNQTELLILNIEF